MNLNLTFLDVNSSPLTGKKVLFTPQAPPNTTASYLSVGDSYQYIIGAGGIVTGSFSGSIVPATYKVEIVAPTPATTYYLVVTETGSYTYSGSVRTGSAQCVFGDFLYLTKSPFATKKLQLTPQWNYPVDFSGSIIALCSTSSLTDVTGSVHFNALIPGPYLVEAIGKIDTSWYISVPAWESTGSDAPCWNMRDLRIVKPSKGISVKVSNLDSSYVLTVSASDARYVQAGGGGTITSASYATHADSASYALSASYAANVPDTSSYALNALSASHAENADRAISASYAPALGIITNAETASLAYYALASLSASWAPVALTSSYALDALSASYAKSASWAPMPMVSNSSSWASSSVSSSHAITSSFAISASYASLFETEIYTIYASYAITASNAQTASTLYNGSASIHMNGSADFWGVLFGDTIYTNKQYFNGYAGAVTVENDANGGFIFTVGGSHQVQIDKWGGISGSYLNGTASFAISASTALTASYITASMIVGTILSASYANSASYAIFAQTASVAHKIWPTDDQSDIARNVAFYEKVGDFSTVYVDDGNFTYNPASKSLTVGDIIAEDLVVGQLGGGLQLFHVDGTSGNVTSSGNVIVAGTLNVGLLPGGSYGTAIDGAGNIRCTSVTASLLGTASRTVSASYAENAGRVYTEQAAILGDLYPALFTALAGNQLVWNTDSIRFNPGSGTITATTVSASLFSGTASCATSASYVPNLYPQTVQVSASWATSSLSASYARSASYVPNLYPQTVQISASWATASLSASYALSASHANDSDRAISASYAPATGVATNANTASVLYNLSASIITTGAGTLTALQVLEPGTPTIEFVKSGSPAAYGFGPHMGGAITSRTYLGQLTPDTNIVMGHNADYSGQYIFFINNGGSPSGSNDQTGVLYIYKDFSTFFTDLYVGNNFYVNKATGHVTTARLIGTADTASYVASASYYPTQTIQISGSWASRSLSASLVGNDQSYIVANQDTIPVVAGNSTVFTFGAVGGSYNESNLALKGNLIGTASWATQSLSASWIPSGQYVSISGSDFITGSKTFVAPINVAGLYSYPGSLVYFAIDPSSGEISTTGNITLVGNHVSVVTITNTLGTMSIAAPVFADRFIGTSSYADTASFGTNVLIMNDSMTVQSKATFYNGMEGTASWASSSISASYAPFTQTIQESGSWASASLSASVAISASYVPDLYPQTVQETVASASWVSASAFITTAQTASFVTASNVVGIVESASYAISASHAEIVDGVSFLSNDGNFAGGIKIGALAGNGSLQDTSSVQIGVNAGENCITASGAVQIGRYAGRDSVNAANAVQIGNQVGLNSTVCNHSVQIGTQAGYGQVTASQAVIIGNLAGLSGENATEAVMVGYNTRGDASSIAIGANASASLNQAVLGYTNITSTILRGNVNAAGGVTASLQGTASYAISASYAPDLTATVVTVPSASWVSASAFITTAQTASYLSGSAVVPTSSSIFFYTASLYSQSGTEGRVFWDSQDNTLAVCCSPNVTNQVGQEIMLRVCANENILNGQVLYATTRSFNNTAKNTYRQVVGLAIADGTGLRSTICGLATEDIASGSRGFMTIIGDIHDIDTDALVQGNVAYLSTTTSGSMTATRPLPPYEQVVVGVVTYKDATNGIVTVNIANPPAPSAFTNAGMTTLPTLSSSINGTTLDLFVSSVGTVNLYNNISGSDRIGNYFLPGFTGSLAFTGSTYYLVAQYNTGVPTYGLLTSTDTINNTTITNVATIIRPIYKPTGIEYIFHDQFGYALANKLNQRAIRTERYAWETGLTLAESASRVPTISAGAVWFGGSRITTTAVNGALNSYRLFTTNTGSSTGWSSSLVTQYNNNQYDNGNGSLVTLSGAGTQYAVNFMFKSLAEGDNDLYSVLGRGNYSLAQAQASTVPSPLPAMLSPSAGLAVLVGRIIVAQAATTAYSIESAWDVAFQASAGTDHNALSNLQGGTAGEYYHLTGTSYQEVTSHTSSVLMISSSAHNTPLVISSNINDFCEVYLQNISTGSQASTDIALTNDLGTTITYYTDVGINSSKYTASFVGGANDGYLFHTGSQSSSLYIGNLDATGSVYLFAGGFTDTGSMFSVNHLGFTTIAKLNATGSLKGTASYAETSSMALTASSINFIPQVAVSASWVSASANITIANSASYYSGSVTSASYALFATTADTAGSSSTPITIQVPSQVPYPSTVGGLFTSAEYVAFVSATGPFYKVLADDYRWQVDSQSLYVTRLTASAITASFAGRLTGNADTATSASYAPGSPAISASYAATASVALNAITPTSVLSASWVSASAFITTAQTASYVAVANISGLVVSAASASWVSASAFITTAQTASYVAVANISGLVVSAASASWVSASAFITTAQTASYVTAANVSGVVSSASYASTASWALNYTLPAQVAVTGITASSGIVSPVHQFTQSYYIDRSTSTNAYTVTNADNGMFLQFTGSATQTVSLPTASIDLGWSAMIYQSGSGKVTVAATGGATLRNRQSQYSSAGQYAVISVMRDGSGAYVLGGDYAA